MNKAENIKNHILNGGWTINHPHAHVVTHDMDNELTILQWGDDHFRVFTPRSFTGENIVEVSPVVKETSEIVRKTFGEVIQPEDHHWHTVPVVYGEHKWFPDVEYKERNTLMVTVDGECAALVPTHLWMKLMRNGSVIRIKKDFFTEHDIPVHKAVDNDTYQHVEWIDK